MKRDASEVIAEMEAEAACSHAVIEVAMGTFLGWIRDLKATLPAAEPADTFLAPPAECDSCGGMVACPRCDVEPADAGRDAVAWAYRSEDPFDAGQWMLAGPTWEGIERPNRREVVSLYTHPPSEAAAVVDDAMVEAFYARYHGPTACPGNPHRLSEIRAALEFALASQQAVKP